MLFTKQMLKDALAFMEKYNMKEIELVEADRAQRSDKGRLRKKPLTDDEKTRQERLFKS